MAHDNRRGLRVRGHGCSRRGHGRRDRDIQQRRRRRRKFVGRHFGIEQACQFADVVEVFQQPAEAQLDAEDAFEFQGRLRQRQRVEPLIDKAGLGCHLVGGQPRDVAEDALEFVFDVRNAAHGDDDF